MNPNSWSDDDRVEFDTLVEDALAITEVPVRRSVFIKGLEDALEERKLWARDVHADYLTDGTDRLLKREQDKRRSRYVVNSETGELLGSMPGTVGTRRRGRDGRVQHHQVRLESSTWEELRAIRAQYEAQALALVVDVAGLDRLLMLEKLVPAAATPEEACAQLGTTVAEWLKVKSA